VSISHLHWRKFFFQINALGKVCRARTPAMKERAKFFENSARSAITSPSAHPEVYESNGDQAGSEA
jgi:hypothetical protein